ncbi:MAG: DUF1669 domain-containing protein [Anaerolineaceae bacterium]|nr:DUF1669 domain-containing protein [Anaerolineaceae bacterium]
MKRSLPFLLLLFLLSGCLQTSVPLPSQTAPSSPAIGRDEPAKSPVIPAVESPSPFTAYFTRPDNPNAAGDPEGVEEALIHAIDSAQDSVNIAMLNLNLYGIRDALIRAHQRGVQVRLVMDSAALDGNVLHTLQEEGIPIIGDRRESLMHNKFLVIDGSEVWTGSLNLTLTGTYNDHNNMVRIRSSRVAEDYTVEFNEMFVEDLFGSDTRAATPYPQLTIDGRRVEVYFSPDDGVLQHLLRLVQSARSSIQFLAFSFTSNELADALIEQSRSGVEIQGVFDSEQVNSNQGGEYENLRRAGLDIRRDTLPGQMHHKIILVDNQVVVTGSYNFSNSAEKRNDENIVILYDPATAASFQDEFKTIFNQAR